MVFHFAKVDVLSGLFSGMLLSNVLRLCSLDNDQGVIPVPALDLHILLYQKDFFFYIRFSFFVILFFKTDLDSMTFNEFDF